MGAIMDILGDWTEVLHKVQLWIRAIDIPIKMITEKNIQRLEKTCGEILLIPNKTPASIFLRDYAKFKVEITMSRALVP